MTVQGQVAHISKDVEAQLSEIINKCA